MQKPRDIRFAFGICRAFSDDDAASPFTGADITSRERHYRWHAYFRHFTITIRDGAASWHDYATARAIRLFICSINILIVKSSFKASYICHAANKIRLSLLLKGGEYYANDDYISRSDFRFDVCVLLLNARPMDELAAIYDFVLPNARNAFLPFCHAMPRLIPLIK